MTTVTKLTAAALFLVALPASAIQVCTATSRGPVCGEIASCPPGNTYNPAARACTSSMVCWPYGIDPNTGRCAAPPALPPDSTATTSYPCRLVIEWPSDAPEDAKLSDITPDVKCQSGADLANARVQVKLLGGH